MGFYIRKSVRVGPLRFNLSKSGIGVSTGIPGLRVGTGPRGTYVHMGRGGLYYRQTLATPGQLNQHQQPNQSHYDLPSERPFTHGPMTEVGSGCVTEMVDTNSAALLAEIERKRKRIIWWPFMLICALILGGVLIFGQVTLWITVPCCLLLLFATIFVHQYDQLKKSVVLMYELDEACLDAYQNLFAASNEIARCGAVWHITAQGDVYDPKYHAGAGQVINRHRLSIGYRNPPYIKTNLSVPVLPFRQHSLYLLPDRILVYAPNGVGAVDYRDLNLSAHPTRFIEDGTVPRDAKVVDHTWRYVNKNGTPDRRFNNNRQIPICQYEELEISSCRGVREILQLSRLGVSERLESAVSASVDAIHSAEIAERERQQLEREERNRQRLIESAEPKQKPAATQDQNKSAKPTTEVLHSALFDILCCIMVADGRASPSKKSAIRDIMCKVKAGWTDDECDGRIASFITDVQTSGYSTILRRSMQQLPMFKRAGRERVLLKCVDVVVNANGQSSEREKALCDQIHESMRNGTSNDT